MLRQCACMTSSFHDSEMLNDGGADALQLRSLTHTYACAHTEKHTASTAYRNTTGCLLRFSHCCTCWLMCEHACHPFPPTHHKHIPYLAAYRLAVQWRFCCTSSVQSTPGTTDHPNVHIIGRQEHNIHATVQTTLVSKMVVREARRHLVDRVVHTKTWLQRLQVVLCLCSCLRWETRHGKAVRLRT